MKFTPINEIENVTYRKLNIIFLAVIVVIIFVPFYVIPTFFKEIGRAIRNFAFVQLVKDEVAITVKKFNKIWNTK